MGVLQTVCLHISHPPLREFKLPKEPSFLTPRSLNAALVQSLSDNISLHEYPYESE